VTTKTTTSNPLTLTPVEGYLLTIITVSPEHPQTLGRGVHCDIRLTHASVSKRHAELRWADERWHLTDLESLNGTHVNEQKLRPGQSERVHDGDRVRLGAAVFQANIPDDERTTHQPRSAPTYATQVTLLKRLKDDDSSLRELNWREFQTRYAPVIAGFARNAGLRAQDCDDVVQEVMLGFYKVSDRFEYDPSKGRFRGYLKRATLNVIRKRVRGGRERDASLSDIDMMDDHAPSLETAWERAWADQIMARAIEAARTRVDEKTFEAFEMYARRGIAADVVAERLDMGVNSVHQAKSRVMAMIADLVDQMRQEEG
jgi:RNA polymerase sigma factor (sigma-70 family)